MPQTPKQRSFKWDVCLVVAIIAFSILFLYLNYSPDTEHWFPAFNDANREALGQLGDYVGGFLNPILGICSVLLLMWSIALQRKEANENFNSVRTQIQLQRDEIARSQIAETINYELRAIENRFSEKFPFISVKYPLPETDDAPSEIQSIRFNSLDSLLTQCNEAYGYPNLELSKLLMNFDPYNKTPSDPNFWRFWSKAERVKNKLEFIVTAYLEHLKVCHVKTTNDKWFSKIYELMQNCQTIGLFDPDGDDENLQKMQDARNDKKYSLDETR